MGKQECKSIAYTCSKIMDKSDIIFSEEIYMKKIKRAGLQQKVCYGGQKPFCKQKWEKGVTEDFGEDEDLGESKEEDKLKENGVTEDFGADEKLGESKEDEKLTKSVEHDEV